MVNIQPQAEEAVAHIEVAAHEAIAGVRERVALLEAAVGLDMHKAETWLSKNWLTLIGHAGSIGSIWAFAKHLI